ncbi:PKD domain-containing protein [Humisphaera borealis]|uniref:PKD domain-containing protein n=1 Tax=Humisphaera borealis TaxID=2807512 RepID=A0A7M2WRV9_9BACT|nr:PKD domain-containing protein [Humisphaera borealis]QOV88004.1 PKD domain-containing protein [Humisphaera borealis]
MTQPVANIVRRAATNVVEQLEVRQLFAVAPTLNLFNSATEKVITRMTDGMTIDLSKTGSRLNIVATPATTAGSIEFKIDGVSVRKETAAPYALGGDAGWQDYLDWTPPLGTHTVQAVQWSAAGGTGSIQAEASLKFTVVDAPTVPPPTTVPPPPPVTVPPPPPPPPPVTVPPPPPVTVPPPPPVTVPPPPPVTVPSSPPAGPAADLYNSATDKKLFRLTDGAKIDLNTLGSKLNIAATPVGTAGSIQFKLDGVVVKNETYAPYTIGGDAGTNFLDWTPPVGSHTLQVLQFSKADATGTLMGTTTLKLDVVGVTTVPPPPVSPPPVSPPPTSPPVSPPPPTSPPPPVSPPPPPIITGNDDNAPPPGEATNGGAPAPVVKVINGAGVAGLPVVVNAVDSDLPNSPLYATYQWDFGDPNGQYNRLPGWTAGHIYDQPGTYTIKLTITDGNGNSATTTKTVTVASDNRKTIYVDASNGSDANPGTIGAPIKSYTKAASLTTHNTRILFKRGETWNTSGHLSVTSDNVYIGAYGSGANPVLNVVSGSAIQTFDSAQNVLIENLTFDSPYKAGVLAPKVGVSGIFVRGVGIGIRGCTFLNVDDGMNANGQPTGFIAQDNDAPLTTGIRGYLLWTEGNDIVALGNYAANSTREHCMRVKDANRLLIAYNNFTNVSRESVDKEDIRKGTIVMQRGSWSYIYGNIVKDGPLHVGPRGEATEPSTTRTSWTVVANNKISNYEMIIFPGAVHTMIRNNVFTNTANQSAIAVNPSDPQGRPVTDLIILDNTGYNYATYGRFLRVEGGAQADTITLGRNTYVMPNMTIGNNNTAGVSVSSYNLNAFKRIFNNIWPVPAATIKYAQGGVMWVDPTYAGQVGYKDPTEWLAYAEVEGDVFKRV